MVPGDGGGWFGNCLGRAGVAVVDLGVRSVDLIVRAYV